ncbi:hypothetical protein [Haloactinomyces albus]|uniref:DUF1795 domain-containing protein n=1 Tax=Haloactinomyces albus TaxID=1352928 RepID=A0AAE4CMN7_9ACTN|nr:hypothetical protein [Haloactinomyces albus]MDR7302621.1 hypothetical protein [Haloactinomyces albus]
MAAELPVPIRFRLPDGWQAKDPEQVGADDVAFVALHPESQQPGSTANITIDGDYRPDPAALTDIADESVHNIEQVAETVTVTQRSELGSAEAPGLGQVLKFSTVINEVARELFQCQVYLSMLDTENPEQRVVLRLALTANQEQFTALMEDFQEFVASVRPDTDSGEGM